MNENLNPERSVVDVETAETKQVDVTTTPMETANETSATDSNKSMSKEEILEKLKNISMLSSEIPARAEIEALKQAFYKQRATEVEQEKAAHLEAGKELEAFEPSFDPSEDVFKTFLNEIKEKRAKQIADEEGVKNNNYKKKLKIIDDIKALVESSEDFNKLYKDFKDLQHKWNDVRAVPLSKERELWTAYQIQSELFYDLIKINNEFRDYDFKKNLEQKIEFCEAVEKLAVADDVVSAFHQLQNYHNQWREIGPVAKELREDLWTRFKTASTEINKRYQSHFESLKGQEEDNLAKKTAICEKLKVIDYSKLTSFKTWNDKSQEVINLQAEWKTIGFVPRKVNTQIFEDFRALCDDFFKKKSEFFKEVKDDMDINLEKKKALCEKAKALKDSTDWKKTTEELIAIQKEWKTIGPVPRRHSDVIWKEFVTACDSFFEQKKKNDSQGKEEEVVNLAAKNEIVAKIEAIDEALDANQAIEQLRALSEEWHKIGFVPFKEKDKAYKAFHKAVDSHYERLKMDKTERKMEAFKSNMEGLSHNKNARKDLQRERDNLLYRYNKLKSELQTYENNMSFLSLSSKGANSLLKDVNIKIEGLKNEMDLLAQKINTIDDTLEGLG